MKPAEVPSADGWRIPAFERRTPLSKCLLVREVSRDNQEGPIPELLASFVIEVRSPHDRIARLQGKMRRYIAAGVLLAWLIDPFEKTLTIHRPDREPETLANPASVSGEGPVQGFVLELGGILP